MLVCIEHNLFHSFCNSSILTASLSVIEKKCWYIGGHFLRTVTSNLYFLLLLPWCFTARRHFSGHLGCGQLTYPQPFFNQRKGENGRRNYFMTNLNERILPDVRIEPTTVRIQGGRASHRATAAGFFCGFYLCINSGESLTS